MTALALAVSACTTPTAPQSAAPAPAIEPLQQYMQRAAQAGAEGSRERAREVWTTAAKTYPASKEPWSRLAQDYFESRNYGQAILAAQEVLLRDPNDGVATSVLTVSGLRVSASGLTAMRQQQGRLGGDTRAEAEGIVRTLRDLLGEPVLPPAAAASGSSASPAARSRPAPRPRPSVTPPTPSLVLPTPSPAPAPSPAPKSDTSSPNPFNVLKK